MGRLLNLVTPLHTATKRDYMARMNDDKIACSLKAREYEADYWDGDRRFGYGGYRFIEGRWAPVAKALIETYGLKDSSSVLDVGCGSGRYMLHALRCGATRVSGVDFSPQMLECAGAQFEGSML